MLSLPHPQYSVVSMLDDLSALAAPLVSIRPVLGLADDAGRVSGSAALSCETPLRSLTNDKSDRETTRPNGSLGGSDSSVDRKRPCLSPGFLLRRVGASVLLNPRTTGSSQTLLPSDRAITIVSFVCWRELKGVEECPGGRRQGSRT